MLKIEWINDCMKLKTHSNIKYQYNVLLLKYRSAAAQNKWALIVKFTS